MLQGVDGKPLTSDKGNAANVLSVSWAFIVGVDVHGAPHFIDHDDYFKVQALRRATLDDIYAACAVAERTFETVSPENETYVVAFLVFCLHDGHIAASPDVTELISPTGYPSGWNVKGALRVLQGQIIAQKTADISATVAVQATLSVLEQIKSNNQFSKAKSVIASTRND